MKHEDHSKVWDRVYSEDRAFFGEEPSAFSRMCYDLMKRFNVKKVLELGCGHGRDCIFFASRGIEVETFDYSKVAVEILAKHARRSGLQIHVRVLDAKKGLPYPNAEFDAVYSHMFFNMHFTVKELRFLFSEVKRVLKINGFHFFSVRSRKDRFYGKGRKIANNVYDVNGFVLRFFTKEEIMDFMEGFKVINILEGEEEPASLYLVFSKKN